MWRTLLLSLCAALTQLSNGAVDMLELEEYNNLVIDNEGKFISEQRHQGNVGVCFKMIK